ncbi:winged helix-turn-helix domain-containing protein [Shimia sp. MMG029]|uniref:winged helix-turn-helix domain-containing protein n=1 Tax=Shimia sp. MMG029 TaxID=3021978 RepID=UPI0022FDE348|nr:crosslink repair DNA glycosylase YcaQ family protein [Shimia sp. MMG029]MDA5557022.1 winged helix DNA-binding domain-containing protein [Shimia sp. MMG029]
MVLRISNRDARRLWLSLQGLAATPTGPANPRDTIRKLGFVQLDSIQVLARAHHHILWSRNQNYRERMLDTLLSKDRAVFEHFTHDASVLPIETYPYWRAQFARRKARMDAKGWYADAMASCADLGIKERITAEGALSTEAFDTKIEGPREMWSRPPHKRALDYMWYAGELATCYRQNFKKFYNLPERVIPAPHRNQDVPIEEQINWLCHQAMARLGFATPGDIKRFWEAVDTADVRTWVTASDLIPVEVQTANQEWLPMLATPDIETHLQTAPAPTSRLRILNPFDPVIRDRERLSRLFGFDYRIEIFVPAAKRVWGYYVYPLLEGDRFVGRIECKADRKKGILTIAQIWAEPGVRWTAARAKKLEAELARMGRFIGTSELRWQCAPPA